MSAGEPVNHSVGVVTARLTGSVDSDRALMYTIVPGSIRAVNKFRQPVTSASPPYDYTVRCHCYNAVREMLKVLATRAVEMSLKSLKNIKVQTLYFSGF